MDLNQYQDLAEKTDQTRDRASSGGARHGEPDKAELIPLLGMVGEIGTLIAEYKKVLRDGPQHAEFEGQLREELGDILWYVANVATKFGLKLEDIAAANIEKIQNRWSPPEGQFFYDESFPPEKQLPRQFAYTFAYEEIDKRKMLVLINQDTGRRVGNPLTDNIEGDDGYRFHDVFHIAYMTVLGWSPVMRKLLERKRRGSLLDETQDGGRANVIDEGISATIFEYARRHKYLVGLERVDWDLLRSIRRVVESADLEVKNRSAAEWEQAILLGFSMWRQLREHDGGTVRGDSHARTLRFEPPQS